MATNNDITLVEALERLDKAIAKAEDYRAERDNQHRILTDTARALASLSVEFAHSTTEIVSLKSEIERLELHAGRLIDDLTDANNTIADLQNQRDTWRAVSGK